MNLTGRQLVDQGIITGATIKEENIQPNSVDLNVIKIEQICGETGAVGFIPTVGKTVLSSRTILLPVQCYDYKGNIVLAWKLKPGAYDITFEQGCEIPSNQRIYIRPRSSVTRNGGTIVSGIFDSGYKTERIGSTLLLLELLDIQVGARIATAEAISSNVPESLYQGQWQMPGNSTGSPLPILPTTTCEDNTGLKKTAKI